MEDRREPVPPLPRLPDTIVHVPDHELIRLIGRGSYGEVWLGRNTFGTYRAIKIVYEKTFRHKRPFEREFNGVQKFEPISRSHEGLVDILQVGHNDANGYFYYVMELADDVESGQHIDPEKYSPRTLAHDVALHKRLSVGECRRLGLAIATALGFLHERGLIHRDVKPSNIVFVNGVPKLADIGLVAEMSEARSYVGTEGFIPPEGPGTVQSDIYSLGKVIYEISTGKDRHEYPDLPTRADDEIDERAFFDFNKIMLKACRADPRQRYKSAAAMIADLESLSSSGGPFRRPGRRWAPATLAVAAACAVAGLLLLANRKAAPVLSPRNYDPVSAAPGASLAVSGTRFNASPAGNIIYFGAVRAEVLSVTPTNLTAKVPAGATYGPVTAIGTNGFVTSGSAAFLPTFAGVGAAIATSSFAWHTNLPTGALPCHSVIADFDGDGRPDLAFANGLAHTVSIYRNAGVHGAFAAFDPPVLIPVGNARNNPYDVAAADVDGDGRIELIVPDRDADCILIYKNVSQPGALTTNSFAAPVAFPVLAEPRTVIVRDLDGDGWPDLIFPSQGTSSVCILRNLGARLTITQASFAPLISLPAGSNAGDLAVGDLDGDGKPDLAIANHSGASVSLYRNVCVPGTITADSFDARVDLPAPQRCLSLVLGDMDGDGRTDLVLGSWKQGEMLSVYRNVSRPGSLSARSFASRVDFPAGGCVHNVALGDFNGDQKPDVVLVTELPDHMSVFENRSVPGAFGRDSLGPRVDFRSGSNSVGVAVADLDGDHRPDVVFGNAYSDSISIIRNVISAKAP